MTNYVKELTLGEVIASSFKMYIQNIVPLALCYLLPTFVFTILEALGTSSNDMVIFLIGTIGGLLMSVFSIGAITLVVSDICVGNKPSVIKAYKMLARVIGRYLGVYFLVVLATLVGMVLLLLPAIIVTVLLMFALPVAVIERKGGVSALKRSIELGKTSYLRNFGVWFCSILVMAILMLLFVAAFGMVMFVLGFEGSGFGFDFVLGIIVGIFAPLAQIPIVLLYYDMRVRKELYDPSALSQELFT